jgi:glutamate formiminotransferase/glutamate formiminotransferase/formiminotetrahydrofolate cyclodeaminase
MPDLLIAVPNVSEGRDAQFLAALHYTYVREGVRVLDMHADPDHDRSVFTLAGPPEAIGSALAAGAEAALEAGIDVFENDGVHPHVGALDVAPVVYLDDARRGAACAAALVAAHEIGALGIPVLLYGALTQGRTRAELRKGGATALAKRVDDGELRPDFGPLEAHPQAGVTLVAARPPLVAFNVELQHPASLKDAKRIAAAIREGGPDGLPGVRAIGLQLAHRDDAAQVSMNIEDHLATPLARVIAAISRHAPIAEAEVVGLPPKAAFIGYPEDLPTRSHRTLEDALSAELRQ